MTDLLLQSMLSNLCLVVPIAVIAWCVQVIAQRPFVAHLLWLIVLAKLVTPSIATVPLIAVPTEAGVSSAVEPLKPLRELYGADATLSTTLMAPRDDLSGFDLESRAAGGTLSPPKPGWAPWILRGALLVWAVGSVFAFVVSMIRIVRFDRLLAQASSPAPVSVQSLASELTARFGLSRTPRVLVTSAQVSPLVWWVGGAVRIVLPECVIRGTTPQSVRWILAHELAHVRRRDHWVRWLEWLAVVVFWWNPLVWWARRSLRASEEICCDALVIQYLESEPHAYAQSLLSVVELLSSPAIHPPVMASALDTGGLLERRFKMIVSKNRLTQPALWLRASILLLGLAVLPIGIAYADTPDFESVSDRLLEAVEEGELTPDQAESMIAALARSWFAERMEAALRDDDDDYDDDEHDDDDNDVERRLRHLGLDESALERLKEALEGMGLEEEQVEESLEVILKVAPLLESDRAPRAIDRAAEHLRKETELSEEQVRRVLGFAGRVAKAGKQRGEDRPRSEHDGRDDADRDRGARRMGEFRRKLGEAVEKGEITREEARRKFEALRREMDGDSESRFRDQRIEMEEARRRLKAAVESGRITREQAADRIREMEEMKRRESEEHRLQNERIDLEALRRRVEEAVRSGALSREQANKKLEEEMRKLETRSRKKLERDELPLLHRFREQTTLETPATPRYRDAIESAFGKTGRLIYGVGISSSRSDKAKVRETKEAAPKFEK